MVVLRTFELVAGVLLVQEGVAVDQVLGQVGELAGWDCAAPTCFPADLPHPGSTPRWGGAGFELVAPPLRLGWGLRVVVAVLGLGFDSGPDQGLRCHPSWVLWVFQKEGGTAGWVVLVADAVAAVVGQWVGDQ